MSEHMYYFVIWAVSMVVAIVCSYVLGYCDGRRRDRDNHDRPFGMWHR